ncbi:hypothetical protein R6242_21130 [Iodobacter sp. CM08]|uniref:hypothetical protein n=1 Tax=Iodobacter sp. CM08 TaxID=3085902 RepID=UPI0029829216|nr:hypothetical protein [Iodobacter sp. CM08]MDW5419079.1 hypothetical protein [Iodobacter sp. CM08]
MRKKCKPKKTSCLDYPNLFEVYNAFHPIDDALKAFRETGELFISGDVLHIPAHENGKWYTFTPALNGWLTFWEYVITQKNLNVSISPLEQLYEELVLLQDHEGPMLKNSTIDAAIENQDILRLVFKKLTIHEITIYFKTVTTFINNKIIST